jgi:RNA polymerase sigma factor (sigma-70 family)
MRAKPLPTDEIACPELPDLPPADSRNLPDEALLLSLRMASTQETIDDLFEEIFHRYQPRVVSWCYAVAKDHDMALDLAQEVFLKVFRSLHAFRGDSRMSTWIYVITRNHCLNSLRKRDADPTGSAAQIPPNLEGENGLDAHLALENAESFRNVSQAIRSILTPTEVEVFWLHYGHDFTLASITRQLLLSNRSGAKAFIVSAKRKLKLYLHNRGVTPGNLSPGLGSRRVSATGTKPKQAQHFRAFAA